MRAAAARESEEELVGSGAWPQALLGTRGESGTTFQKEEGEGGPPLLLTLWPT